MWHVGFLQGWYKIASGIINYYQLQVKDIHYITANVLLLPLMNAILCFIYFPTSQIQYLLPFLLQYDLYLPYH